MTAKELLEQATPLPWHSTVLAKTTHDPNRIPSAYSRPVDEVYIVNIGRGYPGARLDGVRKEADAALIVYAVNRLPDYEAAVDALERLAGQAYHFAEEGHACPAAMRLGARCTCGIGPRVDEARAALARLRGAS